MADELPDSIPAAIPSTDPSQRPPHVQGEIDGMRAVPDTGGEPWATRLDPPHPVNVAKAVDGDLDDFTAALAAADVKWAHDLGDEQSAPPYIQFLASTVWPLCIQPRLVVEADRDFYSMLLDRCGFAEDGELSAGGSADNDLAAERADAVLAFIELAKGSVLPRKLLPVDPRPAVDGDALREHAEDLWSALDWTLWGHGLGDVLRERMADTMLAALPAADLDQALQLMQAWKERRGYPVLHEQFAQLRSEVATMAADALSAEQRADRTIQGLRADLEHENRMVQQARRKALKLQDELNELRSRPAIPADTVVLPDNWESQIRRALNAHLANICAAGSLCEDKVNHDGDAERCADDIAGDIATLINDWLAPAVRSDTTTDDCGCHDFPHELWCRLAPKGLTMGGLRELIVKAMDLHGVHESKIVAIAQPDGRYKAVAGADVRFARGQFVFALIPAEQSRPSVSSVGADTEQTGDPS